MGNERRFAIKSVKTLEESYHKYDGERISHIKVNYALMLSQLTIIAFAVTFGGDNIGIATNEGASKILFLRREGNELVEFFDFELLTKLVCLFDSQNKMNSEIN